MAGSEALEWEAIARAKRSGHGQATDAHVVSAALGAGNLPADLVSALESATSAQLAALPTTFGTPELTESAHALLARIADYGSEEALRFWLAAADEPSAAAQATSAAGLDAGPGGLTQRPGQPATDAPAPRLPTTQAGAAELTEAARAEILAAARADMDQLVGLLPVKEHITELVNWTVWNRARQAAGMPTQQQGQHLVFTGPPGTGKTTVARIYGRMMHGLGLLQTDRFVEVSRTDLVAEHVGGTAQKTKAVLQRATDGVLFIDEAYSLTPEQSGAEFGQEAIATILAYMENNRDRIVVIAAGYDKEMSRFLDSNPGLRSRFGTVIDFPRYSADELVAIFTTMAAQQQLDVDEAVIAAARQRINRVGGGNARNVRILLERATRRMATRAMADGRIEPDELRKMQVSDLLGGPESQARQAVLDSALADLRALVGLDSVKSRITDLVSRQAWTRARIEAGLTVPEDGLNLVFTGPPGTGKTTVARIVARIYQGLGLLDRGQLVEVTRKDLVGEYVGQTAPRTQAAMDRAEGGVLFIDEAHSLSRSTSGDYGAEAVNNLVAGMEERHGSLAVILAGYSKEMAEFLRSNPGLRSRVGAIVEFGNYTQDELVEIFSRLLTEMGLDCDDAVRSRVAELLSSGVAAGEAGNARYVRTLVEDAVGRMATRVSADGQVTAEELRTLTVADLPDPPAASAGFGF